MESLPTFSHLRIKIPTFFYIFIFRPETDNGFKLEPLEARTVTFVVSLVFLSPKFWAVVGTYECYLLFYECRWVVILGGDGGTSTLHAVIELFALTGGGDPKT